jgi:hypothetical protein
MVGFVAEVLAHTEDPEHHCQFLARTANPFDALAGFENHITHGWSLDAILITDSGALTQRPLGIITTFDIPVLVAGTSGRGRLALERCPRPGLR